METIADFAVKPFSSEHLCKHFKVLETVTVFSTSLTQRKLKKTRTFQGIVLEKSLFFSIFVGRNGKTERLHWQFHWLNRLKVPERIKFKLAVLVYRCLHPTAPPYLAEELHQSSADEARRRLRSASTSSLVVRRTGLSTIGDRAFPVAVARPWNTLPLNVTSASSISVFRKRSKTHLFSHSYPESPVVPLQWLWHFEHYNRSLYLFTYVLHVSYIQRSRHVNRYSDRDRVWNNSDCRIETTASTRYADNFFIKNARKNS